MHDSLVRWANLRGIFEKKFPCTIRDAQDNSVCPPVQYVGETFWIEPTGPNPSDFEVWGKPFLNQFPC